MNYALMIGTATRVLDCFRRPDDVGAEPTIVVGGGGDSGVRYVSYVSRTYVRILCAYAVCVS